MKRRVAATLCSSFRTYTVRRAIPMTFKKVGILSVLAVGSMAAGSLLFNTAPASAESFGPTANDNGTSVVQYYDGTKLFCVSDANYPDGTPGTTAFTVAPTQGNGPSYGQILGAGETGCVSLEAAPEGAAYRYWLLSHTDGSVYQGDFVR